MADLQYYKSERFIWDFLCRWTGTAISTLYGSWKERGVIEPFLIGWPAEKILDDKGIMLSGPCLLNLPEDRTEWSLTIRTLTQRVKAYALLLIEQQDQEVLAILESHHGTRSWTIPIVRSGDIKRLGEAKVQNDVHSIGLLWQKPSARLG